MSVLSKKTFAAAIAAVTLGVGVAATSTPAAAWGFHPHHFGGWHGGGFGIGFAPAFAAPVSGGDCYLERRPVRNRFGMVVGYRRIRVCD